MHRQGADRNQVEMFSLENCVAEDAFVRIMDEFMNVCLMFTVYKLLRCCTILRVPELIKALKKSSFGSFLAIRRLFAPPLSFQAKMPVHIFYRNLYAPCA